MAASLGYIHIDTGAMYRAVTWLALEKKVPFTDRQALGRLARQADIRFSRGAGGRQLTWCQGQDVTEVIRTPRINNSVSGIAAVPEVRAALVEQQRRMAACQDVVMDGRDIGTVVLPRAECKIFLTASVEERARRRLEELTAAGQEISLEKLAEEIALRDYQDSHRSVGPLRQAEDAVLLDTTGLSFQEVVDHIVGLARRCRKTGRQPER
ncbi:MAG: (d)CMP kinase [Peptococcaceae bacterium]|nr:(d)CMP kinase [Peptococcaceae bacterium]